MELRTAVGTLLSDRVCLDTRASTGERLPAQACSFGIQQDRACIGKNACQHLNCLPGFPLGLRVEQAREKVMYAGYKLSRAGSAAALGAWQGHMAPSVTWLQGQRESLQVGLAVAPTWTSAYKAFQGKGTD